VLGDIFATKGRSLERVAGISASPGSRGQATLQGAAKFSELAKTA
jgi:hypothetical protein